MSEEFDSSGASRRKPKSVWVTDFNTESVKKFYEEFVDLELNKQVNIIPIFVNSYGGQVYSLIAKRDIMKTSDKDVATICLGKAMSCGASLLAAGDKGLRFASPDSRILVHQVSSVSMGKTADIKEDAMQTQLLNEMMMKNLAKDIGSTVSKIKQEIRNRENTDWTMTAQEAKKWGIVDHIGVPRHVFLSIEPETVIVDPSFYGKKEKRK